MKKHKFLTIAITALLTFAIFVYTVSPTAEAILSKTGTITLHVTDSHNGKPLEGAVFRLYYFASAHEKGNGVIYKFVSPYDKANIGLDDLQDPYLAVHLTQFALSNSLPYIQKSADKDGTIVFDNLTPGLYLIVPAENFEGYFRPSPFVINMPKYDSGKAVWEYDVIATPKMLIIDSTENDLTTYISVQKKWETDEATPKSVTVVLLRDLEEYAEIKLDKSNNWYYRWDSLPKNHVWNVIEKNVPDGYTVQYETSSNTVTIINKADPDDEDDNSTSTTTPGGDTPTVTPPHEDGSKPGVTTPGATKPGTTTPGDSSQTTKPDELVDTGQLNWPIPILSIAGLLLFSLGWALLNISKKEDETV